MLLLRAKSSAKMVTQLLFANDGPKLFSNYQAQIGPNSLKAESLCYSRNGLIACQFPVVHNGHAQVHAPYKWLLKESREPRLCRGAAYDVLQFRQAALKAESLACNGRWGFKPPLGD